MEQDKTYKNQTVTVYRHESYIASRKRRNEIFVEESEENTAFFVSDAIFDQIQHLPSRVVLVYGKHLKITFENSHGNT